MIEDNYVQLASGILAFGKGLQEKYIKERVKRWHENIRNTAFFLILAGSQTAEIDGISSAGSTPISRRYTAIADAELLRNLEENVEELIHSTLYPVWHWKVGNDNLPERIDPYGNKETDIVKKTIEYMPAGGIFVTDHRHQIVAQGSEGRALRVEGYLTYFKQRLFSGLGVSGVDMGEGDSANKATAQVLSNTAIQHIEALQLTMKIFLESFVLSELMLEKGGAVDIYDPEKRVEIKFGTIDKEAKTKLEKSNNSTIFK